MADLTAFERRKLEKLFGMGGRLCFEFFRPHLFRILH